MVQLTERPQPLDAADRRRRRAATVVGAVLAAVVVWAVAGPLLGVDLSVSFGAGEPPTEVGLLAVVVSSALASLVAWGLLALLERSTARGLLVWTALAVVALALSFAPLLAAGGTAAGTRTALALLHLVVAAVLVPGLRRTSPQRR